MNERLGRASQKNPLDTLASGVAHELNNILYPMMIYSNLLLDKAEAGSEEYLDLSEIIACAHRAGDLMSKIRMYCGHIESSKTDCDLVTVITKAMESIREVNHRSVTFEVQICGDEIPANCDAGQITQVLTHLCANAVQAVTDRGEIRITLEPATLTAFECFDGTILSGEYARLTVTDNGVGMNEAVLARIFDPFFTTLTQATGLGLSVVIGLVRCHRGGISIFSKPNIGTSIEVYLPLAEGETAR